MKPWRSLALLVALLPDPATAAGEALSLTEALRVAIETHPAVQVRRSGIEAASEDVKSAEWRRFPTLTTELGHLTQGQATAVTSGSQSTATWRVQQPLWTFGKITTEIEQSTLRREAAVWSLAEAEQDLLARVAQAFVDLTRLEERVAIATDNLREHTRLYDLIGRRAAQQVSSQADVALASARMQQAQTELMTLQSGRNSVRATLEQLLGRPVAEVTRQDAPAPAQALAADDALAAARSHSPALHRLAEEQKLAGKDVDARRAAIMPNVSLRYEKFSGAAALVPFDRWMVVLDFQPGAGLSSLSAVQAAARRADMAASAREAGWRDVTEKTLTQLNEARSFAEQREPARAYARAAGEVMASYLRQYTAGRKSWLDALNAQREWTQARYAAADVEAGALLSQVKLDILTGRLTRRELAGNAGGAP